MITIIGGEPTLHPQLESWTRGVAAAWPDRPVCIQSNGLLNVEKFNWWKSVRAQYPNVGTAVAVHSINMKHKFREEQQFDATMFTDCAIQANGKSFTVHDSDPEKAWGACTMRHSHTILHGLLHRCPTVAILPEFQKQYQVDLTSDQQQLLNSYVPLDHNCSDEELLKFLQDSNSEMPQCRLCPGEYREAVITFDPQRKKYPKRQN